MISRRRDDGVVTQRKVSRDAEGGLTDPASLDPAIRVPVVNLPTPTMLTVLTDDVNIDPLPGIDVDVDASFLPLAQHDDSRQDTTPGAVGDLSACLFGQLRGRRIDPEPGKDGDDGRLLNLDVLALPVVVITSDAEVIGQGRQVGICQGHDGLSVPQRRGEINADGLWGRHRRPV